MSRRSSATNTVPSSAWSTMPHHTKQRYCQSRLCHFDASRLSSCSKVWSNSWQGHKMSEASVQGGRTTEQRCSTLLIGPRRHFGFLLGFTSYFHHGRHPHETSLETGRSSCVFLACLTRSCVASACDLARVPWPSGQTLARTGHRSGGQPQLSQLLHIAGFPCLWKRLCWPRLATDTLPGRAKPVLTTLPRMNQSMRP